MENFKEKVSKNGRWLVIFVMALLTFGLSKAVWACEPITSNDTVNAKCCVDSLLKYTDEWGASAHDDYTICVADEVLDLELNSSISESVGEGLIEEADASQVNL